MLKGGEVSSRGEVLGSLQMGDGEKGGLERQ